MPLASTNTQNTKNIYDVCCNKSMQHDVNLKRNMWILTPGKHDEKRRHQLPLHLLGILPGPLARCMLHKMLQWPAAPIRRILPVTVTYTLPAHAHAHAQPRTLVTTDCLDTGDTLLLPNVILDYASNASLGFLNGNAVHPYRRKRILYSMLILHQRIVFKLTTRT
jgi:hypothetical protein